MKRGSPRTMKTCLPTRCRGGLAGPPRADAVGRPLPVIFRADAATYKIGHRVFGPSEHEFNRQLPDTRIARAPEHEERSRVDVPRGIQKLCVIECIEELGAELQRPALREAHGLQQRQVRVVDSRSMEEPP